MPSLLWINKGSVLSEKAEQNFLDSQRTALAGNDNAHKIGLAQGNLELQVLNINPQQSQFLETRRFNAEQIIQIYRIPPHLIGMTEKVTSWGTGIAEQNTAFATYTLGPRFVAAEKQDRRALFTREEKAQGLYLKRNVAAILRADIKGRYEAYKTGIETGFIQPNEVRELEDLSPAPGLDHYRFPLNTAYFDDAGNLVNPNATALPQRPEASR
jgi:HK97 family phage portal protein